MNAESVTDLLLGSVCSAFSILNTSSAFGQFWKGVFSLPPSLLLFIVFGILFLVLKEIIMRGSNSYNSANGFTPAFNSFVGSFTYVGLQTVTFLLLSFVFGQSIYCMPWPYVAHIFVFVTTGLFLHLIGFWPELRIGRRR